ncbi:MAG: hypothetical protein ABSH53_19615 [Holophaga sp.]
MNTLDGYLGTPARILALRMLALVLTASPLAVAQDAGWYVGANAGRSRAKIDDAIGNHGDIDLFSAGVVYRFGRHAPAAAQTAPAPAALASEPSVAEAPVLVVVPVPTPTQQYCTILDVQFAIDKGDIQTDRFDLELRTSCPGPHHPQQPEPRSK